MQSDPDLWLLIVGGTPRQVKYYQQLAQDYGIGQRCRFTGKVSPQLAKYYASLATVQVSTRSSGSNTPLKIYEQISRGIPLVATNIESHTQVLNNDVAFLVEPTPAQIATGIKAALSNGTEPQQKAARAKKLYEQRYSQYIYKDKMRGVLAYLRDESAPSPTPTMTRKPEYVVNDRGRR
jgi:glycosyltransferase involved in cell wall biosynthesis